VQKGTAPPNPGVRGWWPGVRDPSCLRSRIERAPAGRSSRRCAQCAIYRPSLSRRPLDSAAPALSHLLRNHVPELSGDVLLYGERINKHLDGETVAPMSLPSDVLAALDVHAEHVRQVAAQCAEKAGAL